MHKTILLLISAMVAVVMSPCLVHADERVPVYVHGVEWSGSGSGSKLLSDQFNQAVSKKLKSSSTVKSVEVDDSGAAVGGKQKGSALLAGLVEGKDLFEAKKLEDASKTLKSAMSQFEVEPGATDRFSDYLEALVYLGASYVGLGYGGDAKDAFRKLATLTNKRTLDDFSEWVGRFDDSVIKKYDKTARKWLKKKKGSVAIQGSDSLQVSIDDSPFAGASDSTASKLTRGRHRVGCKNGSDGDVKYAWVKVKSRKTVPFDCANLIAQAAPAKPEVDIKTFVSNVKMSPNDLQTVKDGRKIAAHLGAKFLVIPFLRTSGERMEIIGSMFSADSGVTVRIGSFSLGREMKSVREQGVLFSQSIEGSVKNFPYQNALVAGFLSKPSSRLTGTGLNARALAARTGPVSKTKTRWYKTWWFWTASAVVVGGLSSAGYFLLEEEDDTGKFELEVTW
jgi:hypothetical protein